MRLPYGRTLGRYEDEQRLFGRGQVVGESQRSRAGRRQIPFDAYGVQDYSRPRLNMLRRRTFPTFAAQNNDHCPIRTLESGKCHLVFSNSSL